LHISIKRQSLVTPQEMNQLALLARDSMAHSYWLIVNTVQQNFYKRQILTRNSNKGDQEDVNADLRRGENRQQVSLSEQ